MLKRTNIKLKSVAKILIICAIALTGLLVAQRGLGLRSDLPKLTENQRTELHELVQSMRGEHASKIEINDAVSGLFDSWGLEMPDRFGKGKQSHDEPPFMSELSDDQIIKINNLRDSMHEQGSDRVEIKEAVHNQLISWGIDLPDPPNFGRGKGFKAHNRLHFRDELTDDQRTQIHHMRNEMRQNGADKKDIRTAVRQQFTDWGIEIPEKSEMGQGKGMNHPGPPPFMEDLTDDQRDQVHELVMSMREQSAQREEIREAVHELLTFWGKDSFGRNDDSASIDDLAKPGISAKNYPNPFNPSTEISYSLSIPGLVKVEIVDVVGKTVKSIPVGHQSEGSYSVIWDGNNQNGIAVPSGLYFYHIQAGNEVLTKSMMLLK
ncbi:MAG: T9SS type A sorting domain-containing protein [Candidatus Marinimicrobia bacterium]|nr:T9SS type A sorting domain-containing protein [Candidatus Neomarinimicrobiota bacterium]